MTIFTDSDFGSGEAGWKTIFQVLVNSHPDRVVTTKPLQLDDEVSNLHPRCYSAASDGRCDNTGTLAPHGFAYRVAVDKPKTVATLDHLLPRS